MESFTLVLVSFSLLGTCVTRVLHWKKIRDRVKFQTGYDRAARREHRWYPLAGEGWIRSGKSRLDYLQ